MGPHTISHQWYRAKGNPIGEYIEVLTWEVYFIPCARWDINFQRLYIYIYSFGKMMMMQAAMLASLHQH
jgi:hypothetical protein